VTGHPEREVGNQRLLRANRAIDPARLLDRFAVGRLSEIPAAAVEDARQLLASPPADLLRPTN
jgi:hypothetical protein